MTANLFSKAYHQGSSIGIPISTLSVPGSGQWTLPGVSNVRLSVWELMTRFLPTKG